MIQPISSLSYNFNKPKITKKPAFTANPSKLEDVADDGAKIIKKTFWDKLDDFLRKDDDEPPTIDEILDDLVRSP